MMITMTSTMIINTNNNRSCNNSNSNYDKLFDLNRHNSVKSAKRLRSRGKKCCEYDLTTGTVGAAGGRSSSQTHQNGGCFAAAVAAASSSSSSSYSNSVSNPNLISLFKILQQNETTATPNGNQRLKLSSFSSSSLNESSIAGGGGGGGASVSFLAQENVTGHVNNCTGNERTSLLRSLPLPRLNRSKSLNISKCGQVILSSADGKYSLAAHDSNNNNVNLSNKNEASNLALNLSS
jgi:hypothetical protein